MNGKLRRAAAHLARPLSGFRAGRPALVDVELSNRCNLSCSACWFHGHGGAGDRFEGKELTTGEALDLLGELAGIRAAVYFGGGEPLVREDFPLILRQARRLGLPVSFTTNGTLLDSGMLRLLVARGVEQVSFSLDGPAELHDRLRGPGVFHRATSAIRELAGLKREARAERPVISVNILVQPAATGRLEETVAAVREATRDGVDRYRIHHPWYITPRELEAHRRQVERLLRCPAGGAAAHLLAGGPGIELEVLAGEIARLRGRPRIAFFPPLERGPLRFYEEQRRSRRRCQAPWRAAVIKPGGQVRFCPDEWIDGYTLGNIREERFSRIWNDLPARRFRAVLYRHGPFPGCRRCSWMYCFQA